jgi:hypothetical protein
MKFTELVENAWEHLADHSPVNLHYSTSKDKGKLVISIPAPTNLISIEAWDHNHLDIMIMNQTDKQLLTLCVGYCSTADIDMNIKKIEKYLK